MRSSEIKHLRKLLDEAIRKESDTMSVEEMADAAGLSQAAIQRVLKPHIDAVSLKNVRPVVEALAQQNPLMFSTYATIACALGLGPNAARAVGRSLAAKDGVRPLEGALVLEKEWLKLEQGGYVVPKNEKGWSSCRPEPRLNVLRKAGADIVDLDADTFLVPLRYVVTVPDDLRRIAGIK